MPDPVIQRTAALDLVIAGAARSGTSYLAAQLSAHPNIDPGSLKEPNFFSRNYERGVQWYDGLFQPRNEGLLRMDASASYTFPQFPEALDRLADHAPAALVVYVVRDPIPRAVSHYLYHRYYFKQELAADFATAMRTNPIYTGSSDYGHWLGALADRFPRAQILVVPFSAVASGAAATYLCERMHLSPLESTEAAEAHKNNVVTFKNEGFRRASRILRRSRFYPKVREYLGANRLRKVRSLVTREAALPSTAEAVATCNPEQLRELAELEANSRKAAADWLTEQDERLGLNWLTDWQASQAHSRT
ncbi:MAG: sulfotransferase domain-containing protein [Actinomycetota bacterium]|nr:sulfotransferase domain-containing protein [Actinomycetota bacterium]